MAKYECGFMAQVTGLESVQRESAKFYTENQNEVHGRKLNGAMSYSTQAHLGRKNEFEQREQTISTACCTETDTSVLEVVDFDDVP